MWNLPLLCLALGLAGRATALPQPTTASTGIQSIDTTCPSITCIDGYRPDYDPNTNVCTCQDTRFCIEIFLFCPPGFHQDCAKCVPDVDPATCPTIDSCAEDTHSFYNPGTQQCSCNPDNGKDVCLATTVCPKEYEYPHWDPTTETCRCLPLDAKVKTREEGPACSNDIFCATGAHKVFDAETSQCSCEVDPETETCAPIDCEDNYHVVFNSGTNTCNCGDVCANIICLADTTVVYNSADHTCQCVPLVDDNELVKRSPEPVPVPEPAVNSFCKDVHLYCIPGMEVRFSPLHRGCVCEWIPGFGPGGKFNPIDQEPDTPIDVEDISKRDPPPPNFDCSLIEVFCDDDRQYTWNPDTEQCECQYIEPIWLTMPGPVQISPRTALAQPTTLSTVVKRIVPTMWQESTPTPTCISVGNMLIPETRYVWNPVSGRCEYQRISGVEARAVASGPATPRPWPTQAGIGPVIIDSTTTNTSPTPRSTTGFCIDQWVDCGYGKVFGWNPKTDRCECHWRSKFGPQEESTTLSTRSEEITQRGSTIPNCSVLRIWCGEGKRLDWDPVLEHCTCQWIEVYGPGYDESTDLSIGSEETSSSLSKRSPNFCRVIPIICVLPDYVYGWDPVTESCRCHFKPGFDPETPESATLSTRTNTQMGTATA